jgi:hypothetical protein
MKGVFLQQRAKHAFGSNNGCVSPRDDVDEIDTFKYSMKRFKNATKCSAFRMLPGIASFNRSSGRTWNHQPLEVSVRKGTLPGFDMKVSLSSSMASWRPSTSFEYSSCSFAASVILILRESSHGVNVSEKNTYSSILSPSFPTLRAAESSMGRVRSMLKDSIQTLSIWRWLDVMGARG